MFITLTFEIPDDATPIQAQVDYKDKDGYMVSELFQSSILAQNSTLSEVTLEGRCDL